MEATVLSIFGQTMSEAEYDAERARLRAAYGDNRPKEAQAKADQAFASLFARSGWTQEKLAAKEGKTQQWVAYRLRFGRFLQNTTVVVNPDPGLAKALATRIATLTERGFRGYWDQTEGDERDRFRAIKRQLEQGKKKGPALRRPIIDKFGDGKWHTAETIAAGVEHDDVDYVKKSLRDLKTGADNPKVEQRKYGTTMQYRIFQSEKMISSLELIMKLGPIIDGLKTEGTTHVATRSIAAVKSFASQLEHLLDEWTR